MSHVGVTEYREDSRMTTEEGRVKVTLPPSMGRKLSTSWRISVIAQGLALSYGRLAVVPCDL